jgi:hypothetical protein
MTGMHSSHPSPREFRHCSFRGRFGIARADITPPIGIYNRNWGAAKHDTANSIHRPLMLTALTIATADGKDPLVLIDADLGWWRPIEVFARFQQRLLKELSLDSSRFLFALTHTHAAAPLMESDPSVQGGQLLGPWLETIYQRTVSTIREALAKTFAGTLDWHTGRCGLASVRDLPDPERDRMVCGFNPAAVPDDTLLLGRITDEARTLQATLVNYACHPTTMAWENTSISPDYIGAMRETMEQATGATAFFLQGASGDLAPKHQYVGDGSVPDAHGRQLGFAALAALNDMTPAATALAYTGVMESGAPLAVWRHQPRDVSSDLRAIETRVDLPIKDWPSADELERQRTACTDRALQERLRRKRDIRRSLGDGRTFSLVVHAWRMGDAVLIGSCCEAYSILQQELRKRFPNNAVICMNLVNGSIGYLPPAELYDVDVYPVWQTPFDRGSLELLLAAMTRTIEQLLG